MAHESFEDANVAAFLNEHFVSIKVDREERPDLDDIYMKAVNELSTKASSDDILLTHVGVRGATMNQSFLLKNWKQREKHIGRILIK